jgi:glycosyltransferase involved in cell wall biosynthesis
VYALKSILAQTFSDWEAIIVDDGSTDDTARVASQFSDPRFRYIYQENRGLSGARNTGIRAAVSETIALLDSDDVWESIFLEKTINWLGQHPEAAGVYCGYHYIDSQGQLVGRPSIRVVPPDSFRRVLINKGNWLAPCAVVFRKRLAEEVGLFDESMRAVEDTDLWIRLSVSHPFVGLPEALVRYRRHSANMTKNPKHMVTAARQLTEKLYGLTEGDAGSWSTPKKLAYAGLFAYAARFYLAYGDAKESACYFQQLVEISLHTATSMPTWRCLVRAHLPVEYQNDPLASPDWTLAQRDIEGLLGELASRAISSDTLQRHYTRIKGGAFLALAEEAVRAREQRRAFNWMWRAAASCPTLLLARPYWGTISRSILGVKAVDRFVSWGK